MTLEQLILEVRRRSDMVNTDFVTDEEITSYINNSASELYDILVGKFEDYYTNEPLEFTIDTGNTYDLPEDFYKLRGLDKAINGVNDWQELLTFNFNDRNRNTLSVANRLRNPNTKYRILGKKLLLTPLDEVNGTYRIWYIPQSPKLILLTDSLDTISGWEEYVIVDSAIKCLQKEESDVTVLLTQKAFLLDRIEALSANRDAGSPESITDVYRSRSGFED